MFGVSSKPPSDLPDLFVNSFHGVLSNGEASSRVECLTGGCAWPSSPNVCPHCRQNAPIVYRGLAAYCTACNRARLPLTERSVNLAGQPSQIGGTLARVMGWLVLAGGAFLSLALFGVFVAIFPESFAGYFVGGGAGIATALISWLLLRGGKTMKASGADDQKSARVQAIFAMAPMRAGIVDAPEVAAALQISVDDADALLTDLAKTRSEHVSLEIDDQGGVYYRVDPSGQVRMRVYDAMPGARVRVDPPAAPAPVLEGEIVLDSRRARRQAQR